MERFYHIACGKMWAMPSVSLLIILFVVQFTTAVGGIVALLIHTRKLEKQLEASEKPAAELEEKNKQSQRELVSLQQTEKSDEIPRLLVNGMDVALVVLDPSGNVTFFNPHAEKLTGLYVIDVRQRPFKDVIKLSRDNGEPDKSSIDQALQGQHTTLPKWTYIENGNGKIPITGTVTPLLTPKGLVGAVFAFLDASVIIKDEEATRHKLATLEEEVKRSQSALEDAK